MRPYKKAFLSGMTQYLEKQGMADSNMAEFGIEKYGGKIFDFLKDPVGGINSFIDNKVSQATSKIKSEVAPYYGGLMAAPFLSQLMMGGGGGNTTNVYKNYNGSQQQPISQGAQSGMSTSLGTPYSPYNYKNY